MNELYFLIILIDFSSFYASDKNNTKFSQDIGGGEDHFEFAAGDHVGGSFGCVLKTVARGRTALTILTT